MSERDPCWLSAVDLERDFRQRRLTPSDVVEAHLARIARLDTKINSYITVTAAHARAAAQASTRRYRDGAPLSNLDGVPFAPKDLYATRGIRTTNGAKLDQANVPDLTATAVQRMESAGAVMLGKLNLFEYATGGGVGSGFGPTRNPWNLDHDPGGSSSGSAAALAAGLTTLSLGTDTGGSIRQPAARCAVVGLKPTYGRVSRHGVTPLAWTLDHAGPMARGVRDIARLLRIIAGPDAKDPTSASEAVGDYEQSLLSKPSLAGRRFAVVRELIEPCEPEVLALFEAALRTLEAKGAKRIDVSLPSVSAMNIAAEILIGAEAAVYHEENMRDAKRREQLDPVVRLYATSARFYLATDYVKAQQLRLRLQRELEAALANADVLACPTDPTRTPKVGEARLLNSREMMWFEFGTMNLGNLTGAPAISLPCGFTSDGLPVGLQLYARTYEEAQLLSFAHGYEQATEWHRRRPGLG